MRHPKDRMEEEEEERAAPALPSAELQPEVPCSCPTADEEPEDPSSHTRHKTLIGEMNGAGSLREAAAAAGPCGTTFLRMELMSWSLASITK